MRFWRLLLNLKQALEDIHDRLSRIEQGQSRLHRKVGMIMAKQDEINALVERLGTVTDGLRSDIEAIKAEHPEVDLSALEARVAGLEGLDAEYPAAPPQEPEIPVEPQE